MRPVVPLAALAVGAGLAAMLGVTHVAKNAGSRLPGTRMAPPNLELILSAKKLEVLDYGVGRGGKHRPTLTLAMLQRLGPVSQLAG